MYVSPQWANAHAVFTVYVIERIHHQTHLLWTESPCMHVAGERTILLPAQFLYISIAIKGRRRLLRDIQAAASTLIVVYALAFIDEEFGWLLAVRQM